MRAFLALLRRELVSLLVAPFVYLLLGVWFLLNGLFFVFALGYPTIQNDLALLPQFFFASGLLVWLLLPAFPPLLTLRQLAEERRLGTLEPLMTAPIGDAAIVLAKYLAACVFFLVFWGGVLFLFFLLSWFGAEMDWMRVWSAFLGALLTSFLFLATGLWSSSWSGNLVLAAGGGAAVNYLILFLPALFEGAQGWVGRVAHATNLPLMLDSSFASGLVDSYALAYLLLLTALFLFLTWVRLVSRRWVP